MIDFNVKTQKDCCKGLIYRGNVSVFLTNKGGLVLKKEAVPLIKKSCKGCVYCAYIIDFIREFMADKNYTFNLENIEHGKLYQLIVTNEQTDWESGIVDSWDLEFNEIEFKEIENV